MIKRKLIILHTLNSLFFMVISLAGCSPAQEVYLTDVPINVSLPSSKDVDINTVVDNVAPQVQDLLPGARLGGIVFTGSCENLPKLRGKIVLDFVRTRFSLPRKRVVAAVVSVNTIQQTMDIHIKDETDYHLSTETLDVQNGNWDLEEVATKAYEQIKASGLSDCDVTITRLEGWWDVRCGPLENFTQECHFKIYSTNGESVPGN
jgi:hypothetical protein